MHNTRNKPVRRNMGEGETIIFLNLLTGDYQRSKPLFTVSDLSKIKKSHHNN
jgi:hypothetical protein